MMAAEREDATAYQEQGRGMDREEDDALGEVRIGGARHGVRGRALRLVLWLAEHQALINEAAPEQGQLWVSWKGDGAHSIIGHIRAPL